MRVPFSKMHGAANDFVVIDHRHAFLPEGAQRAAAMARWCDRRRGIGADGVLLLEQDPELDFAMRYHNADGGAADYCGNGARCLVRFALELGLGTGDVVRFRTPVGIQEGRRLADGGFQVRFGEVAADRAQPPIDAAGRSFSGRVFGAGVPHFVTAVARVEDVPLAEWAPALRRHAVFGAEGANVDFVAPLGPGTLAMRTWERGVEGETLACGSGAIASALWAARQGWPSPVRVRTAGGDTLEVGFRATGGGWDVSLSGPAEVAFVGTWCEAGCGHATAEDPCSKD